LEPQPDNFREVARILGRAPRDFGEVARILAPQPDDSGEVASILEPGPDDFGEVARILEPEPDDSGEVARILAPQPDNFGEVARILGLPGSWRADRAAYRAAGYGGTRDAGGEAAVAYTGETETRTTAARGVATDRARLILCCDG
jgi:hypothetical protein